MRLAKKAPKPADQPSQAITTAYDNAATAQQTTDEAAYAQYAAEVVPQSYAGPMPRAAAVPSTGTAGPNWLLYGGIGVIVLSALYLVEHRRKRR